MPFAVFQVKTGPSFTKGDPSIFEKQRDVKKTQYNNSKVLDSLRKLWLDPQVSKTMKLGWCHLCQLGKSGSGQYRSSTENKQREVRKD